MAVCLLQSLIAFPLLFVLAIAIKGGTQVSQCGLPGVVAFLLPGEDAILCNGIKINGNLYTSEFCGFGMETAILPYFPVDVVYGDGTQRVTIPVNSTGTVNNGVYTMNITEPMVGNCADDATLYDYKNIDFGTCQVVGYGGDELSAKIFDGKLYAAALTKSTSNSCCKTILNFQKETDLMAILNKDVPLNCMASSGSACGMADLGEPVYCKNSDGKLVVVGLTATAPCENGGTFVVHDLTGRPDFKFGFNS